MTLMAARLPVQPALVTSASHYPGRDDRTDPHRSPQRSRSPPAAPAAAAPDVSLDVDPLSGVQFGKRIDVTGTATDGATPLAGRQVRLESRRFPYRGAWTLRGTQTTNARGEFAFAPKLDRNHEVRVRLVGRGVLPGDGTYVPPEGDTLSVVRDVFVLPAFTLDFEQLRRGVIRITQVYSVPKDVKLTKPTRFYVGPCKLKQGRCTAKSAPLKAKAKTKKLRKGRYRARAKVKIPRASTAASST